MQHTKAVFWIIANSGKHTKLSAKLASLAILGFLFISCAKEDSVKMKDPFPIISQRDQGK